MGGTPIISDIIDGLKESPLISRFFLVAFLLVDGGSVYAFNSFFNGFDLPQWNGILGGVITAVAQALLGLEGFTIDSGQLLIIVLVVELLVLAFKMRR